MLFKDSPMVVHLALTSYLVLVFAVLMGAAGLPLPLNLVLAGAGGLAREGHLNAAVVLTCSVLAAVIGDSIVYSFGRYLLRRVPVPRWVRRRAAPLNQVAHTLAGVQLDAAIFLTRWTLTAAATPVNLLAGTRRHPWWRFLLVDAGGEVLWALISFLPGFLLGDQWLAVAASTLGVALLLAVAVPAVLARVLANRQKPLPHRQRCAA
jgi:membrane-associated protein